MARAIAFWLSPIGLRNSSARISPGCGLGNSRSAMVVDDFDIGRTSFCPNEADAPLVVDPDAHLPVAIAMQGLQTVAGRNTQVRQRFRLVEQTQLPQGDGLHVGRQAAA